MTTAAEAVLGYLTALGGDDPDTIARYVSDEFHNEHLSALGSDSRGRAEYRTRLPGFLAQFPTRRYDIERVVEQEREGGTDVVVGYVLHAVHDGTEVSVPGIMWLTVADGLIERRTDCWDSLVFLRQTDGGDDASVK